MNITNREQPNLDFLLQKLNYSDPYTQEEAALEIAKIGQNNQVLSSALLNHLQTNDLSFKGAIIYSLGELGSNEAIPALMELLDSSDEEIRWATVEALEKIGSNEIIPKIIACLEKESFPDIRGAILRTLGNFYTEETLLILYKYAECDNDTFVRRSASKSLQKIARAYGINDTDLESSLSNKSSQMREWKPLEWLKKGISELAQTIGNWEEIIVSSTIPIVIPMGEGEGTTVSHSGFKKSLSIAGEPYELKIICQDRDHAIWNFRLQRSQPSAKIPAGVKLRLIDQDGNDFLRNEHQAEEAVEYLSVEVQLEPGEGLIWQIEPEPDDYQRF